MRIDVSNPIARQVAAESNTKNGRLERSLLPSEDKASFSHGGLSVETMVQSALSPSPLRQERVAALRDAVNSGTYALDADKIAQAMISEYGN